MATGGSLTGSTLIETMAVSQTTLPSSSAFHDSEAISCRCSRDLACSRIAPITIVRIIAARWPLLAVTVHRKHRCRPLRPSGSAGRYLSTVNGHQPYPQHVLALSFHLATVVGSLTESTDDRDNGRIGQTTVRVANFIHKAIAAVVVRDPACSRMSHHRLLVTRAVGTVPVTMLALRLDRSNCRHRVKQVVSPPRSIVTSCVLKRAVALSVTIWPLRWIIGCKNGSCWLTAVSQAARASQIVIQ